MLTRMQALPTAEEIHAKYPIDASHRSRVDSGRRQIEDIIAGRDSRLMVIAGPCSIGPDIPSQSPNPLDAAYEYADRLSRLQEKVRDQILIVMRCYTQKPRTTVGWKGVIQQPNPLEEVNLTVGAWKAAEVMHRLSKQHPIADEMLNVDSSDIFDGFLAWEAIGARTSESQPHRELASGKDIPIGVKNPTGGDLKIAANSVQAVQRSHIFPFGGYQVESSGNPYGHLVLRGGANGTNYDPENVGKASNYLEEEARGIVNPAIIIDASHDNSKGGNGKNPDLQGMVINNIMDGLSREIDEFRLVKGVMMESHLLRGSQKDKGPEFIYGKSITDPCIDWEGTEEIAMKMAEINAKRRAA